MKDLFYLELRKRVEEIRELELKEQTGGEYHITEGGQMLIDTICRMKKLTNIARKKGLMDLEEEANKVENLDGGKYLLFLIERVCDGVSPEYLEELALTKYFASACRDYRALQYLMMIKGSLMIQQATNPLLIEYELMNMLPEEINEYLEANTEDGHHVLEWFENDWDRTDKNLLTKLCEDKGEVVESMDECYYIVKMVEELFLKVSDKGIKRLLRDVEFDRLSIAMKALNGKARKNIFNNMSGRLAATIAEDMKDMGPVKLSDAGKECQEILFRFLKLMEYGEIVSTEESAISEMGKVFMMNKDKETVGRLSEEAEKTDNKLRALWLEYLFHSDRMIGDTERRNENVM